MKKLLVSILLLLYGLSSSGMSVYVHYCCGKIDKVDFSADGKMSCPASDHPPKKGCCDSKEFSPKIKDTYTNSALQFSFKQLQSEMALVQVYIAAPVLFPGSRLFCSNSSPPIFPSANLTVLYGVFRI
ncbi:MAG: hypothetical protein ABL872_05240 [Lacibacter sp.]